MSYTLPFEFSLLSNIQENTHPNIICEITSEKDISLLWDMWFNDEIIALVTSNYKKADDDKEKTLTFYSDDFNATKSIFFFPNNEDIVLERGNFISKREKAFTYISSEEDVLSLMDTLILSNYSFTHFLSKKPKDKHISLLSTATSPVSKKDVEVRQALLSSIYTARDLVNLPPSKSTPEQMVSMIQSFPWKNTTLKIMKKSELEKLWFNLLLAVSYGSDKDPYVVIFERKKDPSLETYAFIGKWVTFDAGGIQIKPGDAMFDMKCDMAGSAAVIGTMQYLDSMDSLPCNLIGAIGLTENMTGDAAYKPLDIYTSYNEKTVEIHHTDAEWRLVLADVMGYVEDTYKPEHIITIATLTGACIYALGYDYAGIIGDDENVIESLTTLSQDTLEKVWRLPLNKKIKKSLQWEIADLKNITKTEKAGSSVGAAFLSYFQWEAKLTHLDIAGPAYRNDQHGYMPKWGTGWGVNLLSTFFLSNFAKWKNSTQE